jgi:6-phosphogluconolactonase (cycloisomerase 2 family)
MYRLTRLAAAALAASGIWAAAQGASTALAAGTNHAIFVANDRLEGNQVVVFDRSTEGTLTQVGTYNSGGKGGKLEGAVVDNTASQGALTYDEADHLLFAVNAGSDSLSVFSVLGDRLALRQVLSSYGKFPVSIAVRAGSVYVLNAEEGGSIQGYGVSAGNLVPIPSAYRALGLSVATPGSGEQFTHTPGQVAFSPDGSKLIVTTKAAGQSVDVFSIDPVNGLSAQPVVNPEPGAVPFATTFDKQGHLLVTEAGPSALASFQLNESGTISQLDSVLTEQAATCWVEGGPGNTYYTSNAGSSSITGFQSGARGRLLSKLQTTPTHPGTVDATSVGRFLYVQGGKEGTVDEFEVESTGALKSLGFILVPSAAGGEGIVAG